LQDRGDCQTPRKSSKTSHVVGWAVGWEFARSSEEVASAYAIRGRAFSRWPRARECGPAFVPPRVERRLVTSCNFRCTGISVECEAVVLEHIGWEWERGGEGSGKRGCGSRNFRSSF
jgi:hypothetical protein